MLQITAISVKHLPAHHLLHDMKQVILTEKSTFGKEYSINLFTTQQQKTSRKSSLKTCKLD